MSVHRAWKYIRRFVLIGGFFLLARNKRPTARTLVTHPNHPHLFTMSTNDHTTTMADSILVGPFNDTIANSTDGTAIPRSSPGAPQPLQGVAEQNAACPIRGSPCQSDFLRCSWFSMLTGCVSQSNSTEGMNARRQTALTNALIADVRAKNALK